MYSILRKTVNILYISTSWLFWIFGLKVCWTLSKRGSWKTYPNPVLMKWRWTKETSPERIINFIMYTCACPAVTNQNVLCKMGLQNLWNFRSTPTKIWSSSISNWNKPQQDLKFDLRNLKFWVCQSLNLYLQWLDLRQYRSGLGFILFDDFFNPFQSLTFILVAVFVQSAWTIVIRTTL